MGIEPWRITFGTLALHHPTPYSHPMENILTEDIKLNISRLSEEYEMTFE